MRACWDATILVLVQPFPASCATCRGTSDVPRVLALTHRHPHKSPSVRQPFAEISGSIAFSPLWFLSRKLCPIFLCQFKGSLHPSNQLDRILFHSDGTGRVKGRGFDPRRPYQTSFVSTRSIDSRCDSIRFVFVSK